MLRTSLSMDSSFARPRLWLSLMGLMLVVLMVTSQSKSCQKVKESSKKSKSFKGLKSLQKLLVRKNVYQSTNPSSIKYEELELLLELCQFFKLFCWAQELSQYHVRSDYQQGKASGAVDALLRFSLKEQRRSSSREHASFSPAVTNGLSPSKFLSAQHTFFLRSNSVDALWKKTSQPRISLMAGKISTSPWLILRSKNH